MSMTTTESGTKSLSGIASFVGAFFATWGLILLAPQLVKIALLFGPAEYFALYLLAFATLGGIASSLPAPSRITFSCSEGACTSVRCMPRTKPPEASTSSTTINSSNVSPRRFMLLRFQKIPLQTPIRLEFADRAVIPVNKRPGLQGEHFAMANPT